MPYVDDDGTLSRHSADAVAAASGAAASPPTATPERGGGGGGGAAATDGGGGGTAADGGGAKAAASPFVAAARAAGAAPPPHASTPSGMFVNDPERYVPSDTSHGVKHTCLSQQGCYYCYYSYYTYYYYCCCCRLMLNIVLPAYDMRRSMIFSQGTPLPESLFAARLF